MTNVLSLEGKELGLTIHQSLTKSIPLLRALNRSSSEPVHANGGLVPPAPPPIGASVTASMTPSSAPSSDRLCARFSGDVMMGGCGDAGGPQADAEGDTGERRGDPRGGGGGDEAGRPGSRFTGATFHDLGCCCCCCCCC